MEEGPGPSWSTMAFGNPTRAKNSYFRRVKSGQLFRMFVPRTNEGAHRNSRRPIRMRIVSRDISGMSTIDDDLSVTVEGQQRT